MTTIFRQCPECGGRFPAFNGTDDYYAKVKLHLYDTFPGARNDWNDFFQQYARPVDFGARDQWVIPQTIGDQIWVYGLFNTKSIRDHYLEYVTAMIEKHITNDFSRASSKVSSRAFIPDEDDIKHWIKR